MVGKILDEKGEFRDGKYNFHHLVGRRKARSQRVQWLGVGWGSWATIGWMRGNNIQGDVTHMVGVIKAF